MFSSNNSSIPNLRSMILNVQNSWEYSAVLSVRMRVPSLVAPRTPTFAHFDEESGNFSSLARFLS